MPDPTDKPTTPTTGPYTAAPESVARGTTPPAAKPQQSKPEPAPARAAAPVAKAKAAAAPAKTGWWSAYDTLRKQHEAGKPVRAIGRR